MASFIDDIKERARADARRNALLVAAVIAAIVLAESKWHP